MPYVVLSEPLSLARPGGAQGARSAAFGSGRPGRLIRHAARAPWRALDTPRTSRGWQLPDTAYVRALRGPLLYSIALLCCPLALLVALPIALVNACVQGSPRRILFRQSRVGQRGVVYTLLKFRTMRDPVPGVEDAARVTRFGRFLRNTHLDELPQLWNVLRGEMHLVGPRPEMVPIERWARRHFPDFSRRLALKPGITGWAQITQGYAADRDLAAYAEKLERNHEYLTRVSARTDAVILARTVWWMVRRRGWR